MSVRHNQIVDGKTFVRLVESGAANLKVHSVAVDELNVFPIPDGDTGENMCMTFNGGITQMRTVEDSSLGVKAKALSDGMLLNARGNSGVILSQLFRGMADRLEKQNDVTLIELATAFECGVRCAYGAVVHPVEGTILTVAREAAAFAKSRINDDSTLESFTSDYYAEAKASLKRTPELLSVLKEAGVTDSGGAGLMYIAEGMLLAAQDKDVAQEETTVKAAPEVDFNKFDENSVMTFGYCTEFLLRLQHAKTDISAFTPQIFIDYLSEIGDSIVAFLTGTILKVHVHTMTPWKVLEFAQRYGEFLSVKIENMTLQHNDITPTNEKKKAKKDDELYVARPHKPFGIVTVASGDGIISLFKECGADVVINGGQGKNPSAEDFIEAFDECCADCIFVLPNNGNIILAAQQAANLYKDSQVIVIETKDLGQAYSALSLLDYSDNDAEMIAEKLRSDMQGSVTGMITRSVRDANINGVAIENNDFIGFMGKTMLVSEKDKTEAFKRLVEKMSIDEHECCIVMYGKNVSEDDRSAAEDYISQCHSGVELYGVDGGQDVYDYIIILE